MGKRIYLTLCLCILLIGEHVCQSWVWNGQTKATLAAKKMSSVKGNYLYMYPWHYNYWDQTQGDTVFKINLLGQVVNYFALPHGLKLMSLVIAPDSALYLAGNFAGTVTVGSETYISSDIDIWLARFSKNGVLQGFNTIASKSEDYLSNMCMNGNGLVLTGSISDTVNFLGETIPKEPGKSFFVAKVSSNGVLIAHKFSIGVPTSSTSYQPSSAGLECEVDAAGNIYVLANATGKNRVDTFSIGEYGSGWPSWPTTSTAILKFNSALLPVWITTMQACVICHEEYRNLLVNSLREIFVIQDYSYGQSGNDQQWSTIFKINSSGSVTTTYRLRADQNSCISGLRKDDCDYLYYTGYWRNAGMNNCINCSYYSFVTAQLSSSLTPNWIIQDSSKINRTMGAALSVIKNNYCFVAGFFKDSLTLASTMMSVGEAGFFARVEATMDEDCVSDVGIAASTVIVGQRLCYPNPNCGILYFSDSAEGEEVFLYSIYGDLAHRSIIQQQKIDIGRLPNGIYFVSVNNGSHQKVTKLVLEK